MPLTVQQLNADTTFLLTFSPSDTSTADNDSQCTILIDPWLTGPSAIFHSSFAVSRHTTEPAILSLTELSKPPDLVIVSQPKSDHCNKETLCTLPKTWKGTIVAVPAAAKKIRAWRHFNDDQLQAVPAYNPNNPSTIVRFALPRTPNTTAPGELTVANIPEPYDLSAVHNAIGITYHPPHPFHASSNPLKILYTPHGLTPSLLKPYQTHHLSQPSNPAINILFHSLNVEANPTVLGGVISNGAPGGIEIVKILGVRHWVGAHDEAKDNGGVATKLVRCWRYGAEEVEAKLRDGGVEETRVWGLGVGEVLSVGGEGEGETMEGAGKWSQGLR